MNKKFIVTYLSGIKNDGELYSDSHLRARQKTIELSATTPLEEIIRRFREADGLVGEAGEWVPPGAVLSIRRA